jgi:hypothetical protein
MIEFIKEFKPNLALLNLFNPTRVKGKALTQLNPVARLSRGASPALLPLPDPATCSKLLARPPPFQNEIEANESGFVPFQKFERTQ